MVGCSGVASIRPTFLVATVFLEPVSLLKNLKNSKQLCKNTVFEYVYPTEAPPVHEKDQNIELIKFDFSILSKHFFVLF